jgi:hypothetical protein
MGGGNGRGREDNKKGILKREASVPKFVVDVKKKGFYI